METWFHDNPSGLILLVAAIAILIFVVLFFVLRKKGPKAPPVEGARSLTVSLEKPKQGLTAPLRQLFNRPAKEISQLLPELEEILLSADVGVQTTDYLVTALKENRSIKTTDEAYAFLKKEVEKILTPQAPFALPSQKPGLIFFVGINGTGKTTTLGKLANKWQKEGLKPLLVAADTFRAAAPEQLKIWASRSQVDIVEAQMGADPASVVFDGIRAGKARGADLILVDTAGRIHTKTPLMEELRKVVRVAEKELGRKPDEIFLVLDATTGQNGLSQARLFQEAVPLTGLVLTKFDGTAKGGILLSVARETGLPLRFVGVGEKIEDLRPFNAAEFVESLFA